MLDARVLGFVAKNRLTRAVPFCSHSFTASPFLVLVRLCIAYDSSRWRKKERRFVLAAGGRGLPWSGGE